VRREKKKKKRRRKRHAGPIKLKKKKEKRKNLDPLSPTWRKGKEEKNERNCREEMANSRSWKKKRERASLTQTVELAFLALNISRMAKKRKEEKKRKKEGERREGLIRPRPPRKRHPDATLKLRRGERKKRGATKFGIKGK